MGTNDVCVVVPVFNEAGVLANVLAQLRVHFEHVVCIDDGSTDGSAEVAAGSGVTVLRHAVNLGQGAALQTGFEFVLSHERQFEHVATFDGDGQHDAADVVRMVDAAQQLGVEVVLGSRVLGRAIDQPTTRRALLRAGVLFTRLTTGLRVTDAHNGLRVFSRSAIRTLELRQRGMAHASEVLSRIASEGLTWTEVPVTLSYTPYSRAKGQRNITAFNVVFDLAVSRLRVAR